MVLLSRVVIDNLLRVADVLIDLLIVELRRCDSIADKIILLNQTKLIQAVDSFKSLCPALVYLAIPSMLGKTQRN